MVKFFKNKKNLLIFAFFASFLISGTFAVSRDSTLLSNLFHLGYYKTVNFEEFVSPDNWKTCDVTPKTVNVRNESNMKVAVRISYEEFWKAADGETDLPLEKDGVTLAEIVFQNEDDWELRGGYYYYKADLEPDQTTSSLFEAVKLSCDANLVSDEQVCAKTATGTVCTDPDERYNGAHYHLKVKIETIQVEGKGEWEPDESAMIYGAIKKKLQINGIDNELVFNTQATIASGNGNGINIRAGTQNNEHPIYYFRGEVDDNNIIWGDYCWKILRTTETGGTKIFYNGPASNGKCTNNNPSVSYLDAGEKIPASGDIAKYSVPYSDYNLGAGADDDEIGFVGYMHDLLLTNDAWYPEEETPERNVLGKTYYVSDQIEYSGGKYHLINPVAITMAYDGEGDDYREHSNFQTIVSEGKYYYGCRYLKTTECTEAIFMDGAPFFWYYPHNGDVVMLVYRYILTGGMTQPELYRRMLQSNVTDSNAKAVVDDWYEKNIRGKGIEADLEDTVFCNDRTLADVPLKSMQNSWASSDGDEWYAIFKAYSRFGEDGSPKNPTLNCGQEKDRFTRYNTNGNGDLRYSIGLMTGDEMVFAGAIDSRANTKQYRFGIQNWGMSMTPYGQVGGSGGVAYNMYGDQGWSTGSGIIRPVVSLKYGTEIVEGGEGTLDNPYVVK